ncbi:MAG: Zn-dependent hydrolase of the beta-lactamase fold-like protein [Parcubacteria group bacterium Gr01-1014_18]|nr:MAG: Zn-dependent hydrolase of the beta-lactamase fold-like protein [Parcubacteria group bacterium Greene0416_36]TSC81015.1 MAG: Zn-dependent hydrolase of the beta-lactamase fold-like protein [Parcubacteria group bacterium Gr01-1014_18]TSC98937.1 MAG: Zn-dependent hydrolase of the beta-lactamase fold-like protein [Parcubacteria group bacterium Greene1014_20]TSD06771.1 MAG: Zn-dependent hydrolase of the beta-lactamase fold-like protein [Parcubacteria group bacterium Greene0714_2]
MQIHWHGKSFFSIDMREKKLLIDPFASSEQKSPRVEAQLVMTDPDAGIDFGDAFVVCEAGEYEVHEVFTSVLRQKCEKSIGNLIYLFEVENMSCAHLGALSCPISKENLEKIMGVDILFIPVGGKGVLGAKEAAELVNLIEPRVVVPMYFYAAGLDPDREPVENFVRALGIAPSPAEDKFKITASQLPADDRRLVLLNAHEGK